MCGLAGFSTKNLDKEQINKLIDTFALNLEHRGRDASNSLITKKYAFIHNLLSVRGDKNNESFQPVSSNNGRYKMVFNGEIYNLSYLINQLNIENIETKFLTSDTYILNLWVSNFGHQRINEIEGTFALVVEDTIEDKLYLTRDRLGIKPLFYTSFNIQKISNICFCL